MFLFPFGRIKYNSTIAIWGGGIVGSSYISQLNATKYAHIKCVIDKNIINIDGIDVIKPDEISQLDVDCIVIAIENDFVSREILAQIHEVRPDINVIHNIINYSMSGDNQHIREIPSYTIREPKYGIKKLNQEEENNLRGIISSLYIKRDDSENLVRIGGDGDGGYLMVDKFSKASAAYSIGIGTNIKWDNDISNRGYDVYMYDHTVSKNDLPVLNDRLHFFSTGLSESDSKDNKFMSLNEMLRQNDHVKRNDMILKMDIEGAEWRVLKHLDDKVLQCFDQFVVEYHGLMNKSNWGIYSEVLSKVSKTHQAIHVHGNNACEYAVIDGKRFPDTIEVSYVRKAGRQLKKCNVMFPEFLDKRNVDYLDEIALDDWNNFFDYS